MKRTAVPAGRAFRVGGEHLAIHVESGRQLPPLQPVQGEVEPRVAEIAEESVLGRLGFVQLDSLLGKLLRIGIVGLTAEQESSGGAHLAYHHGFTFQIAKGKLCALRQRMRRMGKYQQLLATIRNTHDSSVIHLLHQ